MEFKGTPKPWIMDCTKSAIEDYPTRLPLRDEFGKLIALINHNSTEIYIHEYVANAKLIAAAPDLLHALQTYLNAGSKEQRREASVIAKKAIEKALK